MKRLLITLVAMFCAMPAWAQVDAAKAMSIARQNMCLTCHAPDHKVVGPAYRDVAEKYKGDGAAMARLMKKVRQGGSGVWGQVAMPPNPGISDSDLKLVLTWILAGAPAQQ